MGRTSAIVAVPGSAVRFGGATDYDADPAGHGFAVTNHHAANEEGSTGETTLALLTRAQQGDAPAIDALFQRVVPTLRRWARGRLPAYARDLADTQDLVQETVLHTLKRLHAFEPRHQGALQAYLRQAIANRIRDEIRRVRRRPVTVEINQEHVDGGPSPLEQPLDVRDSKGTKRRCCASKRPTAKPSSRAWNCSKATKKSLSRLAGQPPMPRA